MSNTTNKTTGAPAEKAVKLAAPAASTGGATPTAGGLSNNGSVSVVGGTGSVGNIFSQVIPAKALQPDDSKFRAELEQIDTGVVNLIPDGTSITIGGQSLTKAQILGQLQPTLDLFSAVDAQVKATQKARLNLKAATPATQQFVKSLKVALQNALGPGNPELASFGISIGKKKALTVEAKFVSTQKSSKTRVARNTLGKRQKADVKFQGQLQAQAVTPPGPASGGGSSATPSTGNSGSNTAAATSGSSTANGTGTNTPVAQ
jgi:hypothetical protein